MIVGFCGVIVGFTIFGLATRGLAFFIAMPIFELGGDIAFPSLQGLMTRQVSADEQGRLQGAIQASGGIAAIVARQSSRSPSPGRSGPYPACRACRS